MKILIIEDNEKLAQMLKKGFESKGYAADYILDGEAGQSRIELCYDDYDIVILDLMMPKKNGLEVCQYIREKNITIPILILTARDSTDDKISALDCGADDYLVKPFSFKELLSRIRAILRRPNNSLPTELRINKITLNPTTRKVFSGKKEVKLTLKEFSLLEYLMRHPNQVLKREQILDNLWDFGFDSFSNVVDVHIKNLRKKLEDKSNGEFLETIRGIGYRIKDKA
jgi:DNA-binding response OmpR family regulator